MYVIMSESNYKDVDKETSILRVGPLTGLYFLVGKDVLQELQNLKAKREFSAGKYFIAGIHLPCEEILPTKETDEFFEKAVRLTHKMALAESLPVFVDIIAEFTVT